MSEQSWFNRPNPLLTEVPRYTCLDEITRKLAHDPLANIDLDGLSVVDRNDLLVCKKKPLLPTTLSLKTALSIIGMHRSSYGLRNPTLASGRRRVSFAIDLAMQDQFTMPPDAGACVLVVKGITGTAKTVTVERTLDLLGNQVIYHGAVEAALWKQAVQLNYLYTGMSHDGSRGGFLNNILIGVDQALGTTYSIDLPKKYKSVERLVGRTIALLHTLYLGVLVVDEIQLENLVLSEHAPKMQLLLLNVINSGIPVVLVGNPYGFAWLSALSQDASRMVEREQAFFHPCGSTDDDNEDWDTVFEGIRRYYLLAEAPRDVQECRIVLKRVSGGIPRVALSIWSITQRRALLDGRQSICASELEATYQTNTFDDIRDVCDGFAQRDPIKLMRWRDQDIPVDYYARLWGVGLPAAEDEEPAVNRTAPPTSKPRVKPTRGQAPARLKAQKTRERKKQAARDQLAQTLSNEDMRMEGLKNHALASLSALMAGIERDKRRPSN